MKKVLYPLLKGRIITMYGTLKDFAPHTGTTLATVCSRLNGGIEFRKSDIVLWCELLKIPREEILDYFF